MTSDLHQACCDSIVPEGLATASVGRLIHHAHVIVTEDRLNRRIEALDGRSAAPLETPEAWPRSMIEMLPDRAST